MAGGGAEAAARAVRSIAHVEVRKNSEATTWYDAQLRDVCAGLAAVSFEGGVWPDREVQCSSVRARPRPPTAKEISQLQPGDAVEVLVAASARSPSGWALGTVVSQDAPSRTLAVRIAGKEYTVGPGAARPPSAERPLDPLLIVRRAVPVPQDLHGWLTTQDAQGCLEQVRATAGLALIGPGSATRGILLASGAPASPRAEGEDSEASAATAVLLLGSEAATRRGEMLLKVHFTHQQAVEAFHARTGRKREVLEALQRRAEGEGAAARASFQVDPALIGRTCGRGGEHLKRVGADHQVEIRIIDGPGADEKAPRTVLILGETEESVAQAREELELVKEDFVVDEERVGWVLSKVKEVVASCELAYGKWTGQAVELCGVRSKVEDAVLLLEHHNEYFGVFEEMGRQREEIQKSFEELDEAAVAAGLAPPAAKRTGAASGRGRGRGKGGAAGRGRGGGSAEGGGRTWKARAAGADAAADA